MHMEKNFHTNQYPMHKLLPGIHLAVS